MVVGCVGGEELLVCIGLNGDFGGDNPVNGSIFFCRVFFLEKVEDDGKSI